MSFDPRVDLASKLKHDYWADDSALSGVAHSNTFQTVPDGGSGGDDLVGSAADTWQMFRSTFGGQSAFTQYNGYGSISFAASLTQPVDIFLLGIPRLSAYATTRDVLKLGPSGTGCVVGWGASGVGRWDVDCGTTTTQPNDGGRIFEQGSYIVHIRLNGASSEVRVNGALYWSGDAGSDDIDGFRFDEQYWYMGRLMYFSGLLTDTEVEQLLYYFNGYYGLPDWAPNARSVALVVPTATPGDADVEAMLRYAIQLRGHNVDLYASASADVATLKLYDCVVYAGNYSDAATNGPIVRALIDAGVPCWIALREPGLTGHGTTSSTSVACYCDVVGQVAIYGSFGWGNVATVTTHDITDFLGAAPATFAARVGGGEFAYASSTPVGTNILTLSALGVMYAIDAGTADNSAATLNAPIVLSGVDQPASASYFTASGQALFQHEIDWLLGTLSPPVVNTVTAGLQLLSPRLGQLIDPSAGNVTFSWRDRTGRTATIAVTTDITATSPTWTDVGSTALSVTSLAVDMSDASTWPEGIWYAWRVTWDDATVWTSPGFKLLSGVTSGTYGSYSTTTSNSAHVYIPFTGATTTGEGGQATSHLWNSTDQWWRPLGTGAPYHEYNGLSAAAWKGYQTPGLEVPPNMPTGYQHYEISAYCRVGSLSSPYFGQATKYWAAEGQGCGVGLYASGTDSASRGILCGMYLSNIYNPAGCPAEGRGNFYFGVTSQSSPGTMAAPSTQPSGTLPAPYAWPSPCAVNDYLAPIRMVVTQINPALARVQAGMAGEGGSSYWLVDTTFAFDFAAASTNAGYVLFKIFGNQDSGGFRDMYNLSVSASNSASGLTSGSSASAPSKPCILELTVYEADRTTEAWRATTDPADPTATQLLIEPDQYAEAEVDFLSGSASIGQVNAVVVDYPQTLTPVNQDTGIMTGRQVDAQYRQAIMGRRARLRRYISPSLGWVTICDGPAGAPRLMDNYSAIGFDIRDTRETERKTRAFQHGETTSMMPRGVLRQGVGAIALGSAIPNVEDSPLVGTAYADLYGNWYISLHSYWSGTTAINSHRVILLAAAEEAARGRVQDNPAGWMDAFYPNCCVWWRPRFGTTNDWKKILPRHVLPGSTPSTAEPPNLFTIFDVSYQGETVRAAHDILLSYHATLFGSNANLPTNGQQVEVVVQYIGPTSEDFPYHWSGTLGELIQNAYDGTFSPRAPTLGPPFPATWSLSDDVEVADPGTIVSTGIRYDSTVLSAMTEPAIIRVTDPVDDVRDWLESNAYAASGYAPTLDNDLQISPRTLYFPASTSGLVTLSDSNSEAVPGWAQGEQIVNLVKYKFQRLFASPVDENGLPVGAVDGIVAQDVEHWYVSQAGGLAQSMPGPDFLAQTSDSITVFGEQAQEYEAGAFAAVEALGIPYDPTQEQGYINAANLAAALLPRYHFGTPIVTVPAFRSATYALRCGDWVLCDLSWMPEALTGKRGLIRYGQVIAIRDLNCAWRELVVELGEFLGGNLALANSGIGTGAGNRVILTSVDRLISQLGTAGSVSMSVADTMSPVSRSGTGGSVNNSGGVFMSGLTSPVGTVGSVAFSTATGGGGGGAGAALGESAFGEYGYGE